MDETCSTNFFQRSIENVKKMMEHLGVPQEKITVDALTLFIPIPSSRFNRQYMLRVRQANNYPMEAAEYTFVNPENTSQEGDTYWPNDGGNAFKIQNPPGNAPWMCIAGTSTWSQHGHPNAGGKQNLIENVVSSIYYELNKVA